MSRDELPSLLLLPYPPSPLPSSRLTINAAYRPPLQAAITRLKSPSRAVVLIVAIVCPILSGPSPRAKVLRWTEAQSLLAGVYSIISIICAEENIGTDVNGGPKTVDARVVLVDHNRGRRFLSDGPFGGANDLEENGTAVMDLPTFAAAYYPWNFIFHVNSEAGYEVNSLYLKFAEGKQVIFQDQLVVVEGGMTLNMGGNQTPSSAARPEPDVEMHSSVCLGGTFDYLHPGHKLLLTAAALLLRVPDKNSTDKCTFIIGVTGDELLKNKKFAEYVQTWDVRALNVLDFLSTVFHHSSKGWKGQSNPHSTALDVTKKPGDLRARFRNGKIEVWCVCIQEAFGPTITIKDLDALIVSGETRSGGKAVNDKRSELGWKSLRTYEVDVLDAEEISGDEGEEATEDFTKKISSSAIRQQKAQEKL
jgi:phosphopantetheine adenylyltransferase